MMLANMRLVTNELSIKNNDLPDGQFECHPRFTRKMDRIDPKTAYTQLIVEIENSEEHPFPVNICVDVTGFFEITALPESQIDSFLKEQAVQIIFPYVRSMISSAMSAAMMPPLIIPIIDVRKVFQDEDSPKEPSE